MFKISHDTKSCTKTPGFFALERPKGNEDDEDYEVGTYLVDGAGFNDSLL